MIFDLLVHMEVRPGAKRPFANRVFADESSPARGQNVRKGMDTDSFCWLSVGRDDAFQESALQGDRCLVVVGEPYLNCRGAERNFMRQKRLGADEVLGLMQDSPTDFIAWLKGNFQIVLLDPALYTCTIWNSRFGISPFYYHVSSDSVYAGTSLTEIVRAVPLAVSPDGAAIAEVALFNYPLRDRTLFRELRSLQAGECLVISTAGVQRQRYWDPLSLFAVDLVGNEEALDIGSSLFRETVCLYCEDTPRISLSLTGGFDGRAALAVLDQGSTDVLCYAFGIPGSLNVAIPAGICRDMAIKFRPVLLDESYEREFARYADQALFFSDGLSTVERANYPFAFEALSEWSPVALTGICGSELLRTFQNVGYIVSHTFVHVNRAHRSQHEQILRDSLAKVPFFKAPALQPHLPEVLADVEELGALQAGLKDANERFYYFLLTEALRKYFGAEVHMERRHARNRFPYLDDDFVDFVFGSPFAGVHTNALAPTPAQRFQSQYFYAYVMRRFNPGLLKSRTDHGFAPADLLKRFPFLWIAPKFLFHRELRRWKRYREFKTEEWTSAYYRNRLILLAGQTPYVEDLTRPLAAGSWTRQRLDFSRAASLRIWQAQFESVKLDSATHSLDGAKS